MELNLDPLNFSLLQIRFLINNLNRKNHKQSAQELNQIVNRYGLEAENYVLRVLFTEAGKYAWDCDKNANSYLNNNLHATLLATRVTGLLNNPAKATVLCRLVDQPSRTLKKILKTNNTLIHRISRLLKLTTAQDVVFSLTLRKASSKPEVVAAANHHLKKRFLDLVQCYLDALVGSLEHKRGEHPERAGLQECSPEVLHTLLLSLPHEANKLAPVTRDLFVNRLRKDIPRELVPIVLAPQLYCDPTRTPLEEMSAPEDMAAAMTDQSIADVIRDIGYPFTASLEECKRNMLNFGGREPTAIDVACTISMMIRYQTSNIQKAPQLQTPGKLWIKHGPKKDGATFSPREWNAEAYVQTLKELAPNLKWDKVILQLDQPEFVITDRNALILLFSILRLGLKGAGYPTNMFPVEYLCRRWTNLEGQMSLVSSILKEPDVFSFADHPSAQVPIDLLKVPPNPDNKQAATWRCLSLVELLLRLAGVGFYIPVMDVFKTPIQLWPDVLMLSLLQLPPPITSVRQELFSMLIPIFLGNHPNSGVVLYQAWHAPSPNMRTIIMHSMADWYLRSDCDQSKLSRILDIAQELKAFSQFLNLQTYSFVIDLACLASQRDYLKLDEWLADKIRDLGEVFIAAIVKFLQCRCPSSPHMMILGKPPSPVDMLKPVHMPKAAQLLPHETVAALTNCLQMCMPNVQQQELQEAIYSIVSNCQAMLIARTMRPIVNPGLERPQPRMHEPSFQHPGLAAGLGAALGTQQLYVPQMDQLGALRHGMASISFGQPGPAYGMAATLGQLVAASVLPSHMVGGPPHSPFAMMPVHPMAMGVTRMASVPTMDNSLLIQDPSMQCSDFISNINKDVDDEVNSYFKCIYNHPPHPTLSIEEVLDMLKKFQDSPESRERDIFCCMLRNLFEEYTFFPQYPDKELHITAQLFGGIIERGLVPTYVSLGLALQFVLESLKKEEGSKMYFFGIAALDSFKTRLKDYHKYCEHVRAIPYFHQLPAHLREYVEYGMQSQEPPHKPNGPVLPATLAAVVATTTVSFATTTAGSSSVTTNTASCSGGSTTQYRAAAATCQPSTSGSSMPTVGQYGSRPSIANASNINTLLIATDKVKEITVPPEPVQIKTAVIFNNLSQINLTTKCDELKEVLTEEYYPWLSQYLVMQRVTIEPNFHALYSNFLDVMKQCDLNTMVTEETYRNIKVLLRSDKAIANFSDRSLLKNLGHWLGMITISKNLPILYVQIDLKELVLEAYHKGLQELLFVVPFVGKILESCTKSKVFKPPNPWTMAIMRVLVELHHDPEMKLNLKFEVEVLCKNLGLDINDLSPAYYLRNPDQETLMRNEMLRQRNITEQEALPGACVQLMLPPVKLQEPSPCMMNAEEMAIAEQRAKQIAVQADERSMGPQKPPPDPKYTYNEVNITSTEAFATKVNYCVTLPVFDTYPHLKQFIQPSLERSIQEWIHPVVDRAIKYALTTCERIVRKDFSLDPEEGRLQTCAHFMMRNLTAGMAMVTCKEQVHATLTTNLKSAFIEALLPSAAPPNMIDPAVTIITNENIELACAFIQKTAVEKALPELDKRLIADFDVRKLARTEGRRHYDPIILTYHSERLPERVRLRCGRPNQDQLMVYEEFFWNIPGFLAMRDHLFVPKHYGSDQMSYSLMMNQSHGLEDMSAISADAVQFLEQSANVAELAILALNIHSLLDCFIITRRSLDMVTGCTLLQKTVDGLIESYMVDPEIPGFKDLLTLYRDVHLRTLRMLEDVRVCGQPWTIKQITYCITECREERRYNLRAVDCLIRNHFVNLQQYDIAISNKMDDGKNFAAVSFAMQIVRLYLVDDRNNMYANEADLTCITDTLIRISMKTERCVPIPEGLNSLVETLRVNQDPSAYLGEKSPLGPTAFIHYGIMHARMQYHEDPPFMVENTELILREWQTIQRFPQTEIEFLNKFNIYLQRININGILTTEDLQTRFLTIAAQKVILEVYEQINEDNVNPPQNASKRDHLYNPADGFMRLVALLIRHTPDNGHPIPKLNLLNKMLGIIAGFLLQDHEMCRVAGTFHQLPYYRLLIMLYLEMNAADPILESLNYQILTAFCHTLRIVKPSVAPGFAYGWLDFLSHRTFIDRILGFTAQQKGWGMYSTLMLDLFKFMKPCLRNNNLKPSMTTMYTGVLRVFLVLLHDFPEFLCDYCYTFCNEIAQNCVQLRNVILSAFPRTMHLPDPHTPNLKVDLLPEITMPPRAVINYVAILPNTQFKKDLDVYLTTSKPVTFLSELMENMQITNESGTVYNVQLINAVVLYVGTQGIAHIRSKGEQTNMTTIAHTTHMDVIQGFAAVLDFEGRYLFLNAIIDQLRYPNSHTNYFSCALLYLFAGANVSAIQEQITRVLLERLIVNHPHPWGLLVTFIELIQNPVYTFWKFDFVNFSPEIEKLIESVIRSCGADPTKFGPKLAPAPAAAATAATCSTSAVGGAAGAVD